MKNNKLLLLSLSLFAAGITFGYLETTFYQYVDENNVLQESWFMPLSILCIILGSIGLLFAFAKTIWLKIKK